MPPRHDLESGCGMIAGGMTGGLDTFVGRDEELAALRTGIREARHAHGSAWFVCGEPGIGKTRLAEELARDLGADQAVVAWGRCWEEGGAPPYWPWMQVLRTLLRRSEVGPEPLVAAGRGPWLTQLVPELSDHVRASPPVLEPELARFRLLDAACGALSDAAERCPLLLILEDLHVADASSIELLEFLARQIHATRVCLVGTLREAEARGSPAFATLARIRREARELPLSRLDRPSVEAFLAEALGRAPSGSLVDAMLRTTEGNPLFLSEIARRRSGLESVERRGGEPVVPQSVQMAISERIGELAPATRELLETASALGREVSAPVLAEVSGSPRAELTRSLAEAVDRAVLVEVAPDVFRFSHILVRDSLHQALDAERRRALHRRMAALLERGGDVQWSQVAHHYRAAGPAAREDALRALRRAATQSADGLAFAEAALFHREALALLEEDGEERDHERGEHSLGLASALHHAGDLRLARSACEAAIEAARRLDASELFAQAALEVGAVFQIGAVSNTLIALLEEALDRLEPGDSATRARVMARLGAARQPADPPEHQFELARRAIAMARRVGDERALLDTLRTGIAALMDLADPRERLALNEEHAALARELNEPLDVLLAHQRLIFDGAELGEPGTVHAAIDTCERIVEELDLEQHRWRVSLMRSMCATMEGRFDDATVAADRAGREAIRASEPWAPRSVLMARHNRALLRGEWDEAIALLDQLDPLLQSFAFGRGLVTLMRSAALARAGRRDEAASLFRVDVVEWPLVLGDLSLLEVSAEAALATHETEVQERILSRLLPEAQRFMSWGILGAAIGPPAGALVGRLLVALGEEREGEQHLREALARVRATGCTPHAGWIGLHIAQLPGARDAGERAREALGIAESLGMPGLAEQARERLAQLETSAGEGEPAGAAPAVPTVGYFQMRNEGGVWVFECDGETFHMKDLKGLQLLSRLVEARGRELHVLDLESPTGAAAPEAGGDAGEVIDREARDAYRRRARELREELEEAEGWNDAGRAGKAREELEALEAELSRAVGLGGRARRSASQAERARVNVQRRLKDAIRRIESQHPALGKHLAWAVRTGTFCSYRPQ